MPESEQLPAKATPKRLSKNLVLLMISIAAIIIAIISLISQFFFWQRYHTTTKWLANEHLALQQSITPKLSQLDTELDDQKKALNHLITQASEHKKRALILAEEVQYLIMLAEYNLRFENSIDRASELLTNADKKLEQINDPAINPLRQALANVISTLQTMPKIDTAALISRINAISDQVSSLSRLPTIQEAPEKPQQTKLSSWKDHLMHALKSLQGILSIRRLEEPIKPLASDEQRIYFLENIRLQLTQAQWAVLHQNPTLYQDSLARAKMELQKHYSQNAMGAQLIQGIHELQQITISPEIPDLSNLTTLLDTSIRNLEQASNATPAAPQQTIQAPAPAPTIQKVLPS
jgi:uroporphyrin-III C-methyltransferase